MIQVFPIFLAFTFPFQSEKQKELVAITTSSFCDNDSKGKTNYFNRHHRETTRIMV
ncbi:hypothetical protein EMIT079MI2_110028 [Bacillus sp. IT-79MI2]